MNWPDLDLNLRRQRIHWTETSTQWYANEFKMTAYSQGIASHGDDRLLGPVPVDSFSLSSFPRHDDSN